MAVTGDEAEIAKNRKTEVKSSQEGGRGRLLWTALK